MTTVNVPDTPNVTLVAFYEKNRDDLKSDEFSKLVQSTQKCIREVLAKDGSEATFTDYNLNQVHATILGCEGGKARDGVLNKWFLDKRHQQRHVNFARLLEYFRWQANIPIVVRFCGYAPDTNYGFSDYEKDLAAIAKYISGLSTCP